MTLAAEEERAAMVRTQKLGIWAAVESTCRLPASASGPLPRRRTKRGALLYLRMSTPNPYSHPSFFPTHAIVRITRRPKRLFCALINSLLLLLFHGWSGMGFFAARRTTLSQVSARAR
jgi:hypothetical protein